MAGRARALIESDATIYHVAKQLIIANLHGHPQPLIIEAARTSVPHANQPSFSDVFDAVRGR
jgi:chemotaxis protein MotA